MREIIGLIGGKSGDSLTDELHNIGFRVAIVAGGGTDPGIDKADYSLITDLRNKDQIYEYFAENQVKFFIVGTGISFAFDLAEYLEERGLISSISVQKSKLVKDKHKTKEEFTQINILTPKYLFFKASDTISIQDIIESLGLPCVVKSNTDAIQPRCANQESELIDALEAVRSTSTDILVEECIRGGDATVCVGNDGVRAYPIGVLPYSKAKEYNLIGFEHPYALTITEPIERVLLEKSLQVIDVLGVIGVSRIDYIVSGQNCYALEVNSVIVTGYHGSAYPFFNEAGINIAKLSVQNAISVFSKKGLNS